MKEVLCIKTPAGAFQPYGDEEAEKVKSIKQGAMVRVGITVMRNPLFHRKFFALVKFAFDIWSESCKPAEYKGHPIKPSFERFRKDLTILCGYYDATYNVRGEVRLEAKSIAFGNMPQDEFEGLYSKAIDVILSTILNRPDLTPEKVRAYVDEVMRFDS